MAQSRLVCKCSESDESIFFDIYIGKLFFQIELENNILKSSDLYSLYHAIKNNGIFKIEYDNNGKHIIKTENGYTTIFYELYGNVTFILSNTICADAIYAAAEHQRKCEEIVSFLM
jgi:hypothetical protein